MYLVHVHCKYWYLVYHLITARFGIGTSKSNLKFWSLFMLKKLKFFTLLLINVSLWKKIDFCNFFCFYDHSYLPTSWAVFSLFGIKCYLERIVSKYGRGAWETNDDIYIDFVQVCSVIGFITCSLVRLRYKCWLLQFHVLFLNVENTLHVHVMILLPSHV